jgi:hypothetical protein
MSPKHTMRAQVPSDVLPRSIRTRVLILGLGGSMGALCAGVLLLGLGGPVGCDKYPTYKDVPLNCSVTDEYDFDILADFETGGSPFWGPSGDSLCNPPVSDAGPDGVVTGGRAPSLSADVEKISGAGLCGSTKALVIRSSLCNDWGSLAGFSNFGSPPRDESTRDGVSFWARAPGDSTKTFTLLLDDLNTAVNDDPAKKAADLNWTGSNCVGVDGGTQAGQQVVNQVDSTGNIISGAWGGAPLPFQCGNGYHAVVVVTSTWQFYTVPWTAFTQDAKPNRVPNPSLPQTGCVPGNGLLTSKLRYLTIRFPKEANSELWLDNLGFYSKKGQRSDAGCNTPQK